MPEIWKDVHDFDSYEFSSFGRLRNKNSGKIQKPTSPKGGQQQYGMWNAETKKRKTFSVEKLFKLLFNKNSFTVMTAIQQQCKHKAMKETTTNLPTGKVCCMKTCTNCSYILDRIFE